MDNREKQRLYLNRDGPVCTRPWTYPDIRQQWLPAPSWSQQKWFEQQRSDPIHSFSVFSAHLPFSQYDKKQFYSTIKFET